MVDLYCASGRSENARSALSALLSPVWELEAAAEIRKEAVRKLARHLAVRAYSHCRKRAYDRAQTLAELAIEADPKSSFAHRALAYALDRKGLKEEAIAAYRRAIEVDANQVIAHYNLARLLAIEGSLDEAAHHYAQSAKLSKAGSKSARYAVRQCAQFLVKLGRADEAVQTLQEWLASDTEDVAARSDLAVLLWSGAGYGEARDVLDPLLSSKTPGVKVLLLAALVAQGNGEAGEAKNYLVRVLRSPVDWRTGHAVADLLDTGSDVGEALRPLVADDPAMASGLQERLAAGYAALAYRKATADDVAGAKADAQKAIQLAPDSAAVQSMAGSALGKAKSYREAVRCYSRAAKLEPKSPAHHASLGWCLYLAGRYDEAMMANKRALALNRTWAYANANVGLLHLLKGDLEAAMASYQKQVAIKGRATQPTIDLLLGIAQDKPEIKAVHYVLGFYYEKKGDQSKAREHYQRYVAAAKDGSFVEEAKKRVAELSPK